MTTADDNSGKSKDFDKYLVGLRLQITSLGYSLIQYDLFWETTNQLSFELLQIRGAVIKANFLRRSVAVVTTTQTALSAVRVTCTHMP